MQMSTFLDEFFEMNKKNNNTKQYEQSDILCMRFEIEFFFLYYNRHNIQVLDKSSRDDYSWVKKQYFFYLFWIKHKTF